MILNTKAMTNDFPPTPNPNNPVSKCLGCGTLVQGNSVVIAVANDEGGQTFEGYLFVCPVDNTYCWFIRKEDI